MDSITPARQIDGELWVKATELGPLCAEVSKLRAALTEAFEQTCDCCPDCYGCGNAHDIIGEALGVKVQSYGGTG